MKNAFFVIVILLLSMGLVNAVSQEELNEAKELIDSKVSCDKLTDEQLEIIGEYYMEQMMPGESHERAHEMMGFEDNHEAEEQFHINMARGFYCGEGGFSSGRIGRGMMGGGMMENYPVNYIYGNNSFWNMLWLIFLIGIITIIIWIIYKLVRKGNGAETPTSILQKRYAKGEINKKQFDEMKREIGE